MLLISIFIYCFKQRKGSVTYIAVKTSQSEDNGRKCCDWWCEANTKKAEEEKRRRFVEWCDDLFAELPQQIKMK